MNREYIFEEAVIRAVLTLRSNELPPHATFMLSKSDLPKGICAITYFTISSNPRDRSKQETELLKAQEELKLYGFSSFIDKVVNVIYTDVKLKCYMKID